MSHLVKKKSISVVQNLKGQFNSLIHVVILVPFKQYLEEVKGKGPHFTYLSAWISSDEAREAILKDAGSFFFSIYK